MSFSWSYWNCVDLYKITKDLEMKKMYLWILVILLISGCCEFESIDGVLKSLRILNGKRLLDRYLSIKPDEKTEVL